MADLQVTLLGQFRVFVRGELVTAIDTSRLQSLFAYLALHRASPISRHQLAFALWPDTGESQALGNLRTLIHRLRNAVPAIDGLLEIDAQSIWLRPDAAIDVDVATFTAAQVNSTDVAELTRAAALYTGDLVPSCYDEWIVPERERLHEHALALLTRLVDLLEAQRSYTEAIGHARQLLRLDPLQETTYRTLMRLYAMVEDRAAALRTYHVCASTLHEELGVEPARATREQYKQLLAETPALATFEHLPGRAPLIGRQAEWMVLKSAWPDAAGGRAGCVVVLGEAGVGKTRLVEELITWSIRQGHETAVAHCYAGAGAPAFAPIVDWLRSSALRRHCAAVDPVWLSEIGRLLPELFSVHPPLPEPPPLAAEWQRQRLFDALTRVLVQGGRPLLLVLDDAQWCDTVTLEWLCYLFEHEPSAPLLLVLTARSEEVDSEHPVTGMLHALHRVVTVTEINLGPLAPDETAVLAQATTGTPLTPDAITRLHQETEGYPLFVVEMARLFATDRTVSGSESNSATALPSRMTTILESRLAQLSPPARNLAGLSAVIGRQFSFSVLAAIWEDDEINLVHYLDELWRRRIVREHGTDSYDFTHGKLRDVAYATLSTARRRLIHRRVAEALLDQPTTPDGANAAQVATHFEQAGAIAQAVHYYRRAAELASNVYANLDAIRFFHRAIALATDDSHRPALIEGADLAEMYVRLGAIFYRLVRHAEAREAYAQALTHLAPGDVAGRARLRRLIGNTSRDQYSYADAMTHYAAALALLDKAGIRLTPGENFLPQSPCSAQDSEHIESLWQEWIAVSLDMSLVYYWQNQVAAFERLDEPLQQAVEAYGTSGQRALYWQRKGNLAFRANRCVATDEIVAWHRRSLEAVRDGGDPAELPYSWFMLGFALLWNRQPAAALEPMQRGLVAATERGDASLQARCLTYLTIAHRQLGHIEAVEQLAIQSLAVAEAAHMPEYVGTAHANRCWLAWRAGAASAARVAADAAHAAWRQLAPDHASLHFQWTALLPQLALAAAEGATAEAVTCARRLLAPTQQALPDTLAAPLSQAVATFDAGDDQRCGQAIASAVETARALGYL